MRLRERTLAATAATILLAACGSGDDQSTAAPSPTATPTVAQVTGTFVLVSQTSQETTAPAVGSVCRGTGGYSDINEGMEVLLKSNGVTLDVARFSPGSLSRVDTPTPPRGVYAVKSTTHCSFRFTLAVPPGHDFYTVTVGRRGERTYTWEEIRFPGTLSYTIGQ